MREAHGRWRKSSLSAANGSCVEVQWRKSSYSTANSNCVEAQWRKSSHSAANGDCVEAASAGGQVALRDSKSPETGILLFTPAEMAGFLNGVKTGAFS